jgi:hypothetical protein
MALMQVLPALKEHRDEFLLKELHKRWDNHKVMVRWLSRFFTYLDRYLALLSLLFSYACVIAPTAF